MQTENANSITPHSGDLILMVGTVKGAFIFALITPAASFKSPVPISKVRKFSPPRIFPTQSAAHARWGEESALGLDCELVRRFRRELE